MRQTMARVAALLVTAVACVSGQESSRGAERGVDFAADTAAGAVTIDSFTVTANQNFVTLEWRVSNSQNRVYIYGSGGVYRSDGLSTSEDVGFRGQACSGCSASTSVYVNRGGWHRFTLEASSRDGRTKATLVREILVPTPAPPSVPAMRVEIDMLDAQDQTLTWSRPGSGCVTVSEPGAILPMQKKANGKTYCERWGFSPTDSLRIRRKELKPGHATYRLRSCPEPFAGRPYCGDSVSVTYVVGPSRFDLPYRRFAASPDAPYTVSWQPSSGNAWYVSARSLGFESAQLSRPSFTFPQGILEPGLHEIRLTSCRKTGISVTRCSNRWEVAAPAEGAMTWLVGSHASVVEGKTKLATITTPDGEKDVLSPRTGRFRRTQNVPKAVSSGTSLGEVTSDASTDYSTLELVVGMPRSVPTWNDVIWSDVFKAEEFQFSGRPSTGAPLDVTFDGAGADIWGLGEFSSAVAHVQSGVETHHDVPLARVLKGGFYERVEPFGNAFTSGTTAVTTNAERIIDANQTIWFAQGGDSRADPEVGNYSRIVRFDAAAADSPATPHDDRLCAIHVPGNDSRVFGLEWDGARIWIGEAPLGNRRPSVLGWFHPSEFTGDCDNFLSYDKPISDGLNRCTGSQQTRCIHEKIIPNVAIAQLKWDPWIGCLWFTGQSGQLGSYCPSSDRVALHDLPPSHRTGRLVYFRGFPWQLSVDQDAVYVVEYNDNDLVRFDKRRRTWSEIHVPVPWSGNSLHSLALDGAKLYFTMANEEESPDATDEGSYFGFVDVESWRDNVESANPARTPIRGTLYRKGLSTLGRSLPGIHHSFRGIDISVRGHVALTDVHRRSLFRLMPKAP